MSGSLFEDIRKNLGVPVKSFRLYALEKAILKGNGQPLLDLLTARQTSEEDEECRLLFSHAIREITNRLGPQTAHSQGIPPDQKTFLAAFYAGPPEEKFRLLRAMPGDRLHELAQAAPELLEREDHPMIQAALIKTFGDCWPKNGLQVLVGRLSSKFLSVQISTLEVLGKIAPNSLLQKLPSYLQSSDPRIRTIAIRGLAQIDPDEAVRHLREMLFSADELTRLTGLENALSLSFDQVKESLYQFMAWEEQLPVIEQAGMLLVLNPDPETPFRLRMILEKASAAKARALELIQEQCFKAIETAELFGDAFPLFRQKYRQWLEKREKARKDDALSSENEPVDHPEYMPADRFSLEGLSLPVALQIIPSWTSQDLPQVRAALPRVWKNTAIPPEVKGAGIRAATRLRLPDLAEIVEPFLHSPDARLVCPALLYFAAIKPDHLIPVLGKYLSSAHHRIKATALEILKSFDPAQALSVTFSLLTSPKPALQTAAFSGLQRFEFSLVRDRLTGLLRHSTSAEIAKMSLCLFQLNPEKENLYSLFLLEKALPGDLAAEARVVRAQNEKDLLDMGILTPATLLALAQSWEAKRVEDEKRILAPKPYSVETLREKSGEGKSVEAFFRDRPLWFALVLALCAILLWRLDGRPGQPENAPNRHFLSEGTLVAKDMTIFGTVLENFPQVRQTLIRDEKGKFYLVLWNDATSPVSPGQKVKAVINPFRLGTDGKIIADLRQIQSQ